MAVCYSLLKGVVGASSYAKLTDEERHTVLVNAVNAVGANKSKLGKLQWIKADQGGRTEAVGDFTAWPQWFKDLYQGRASGP